MSKTFNKDLSHWYGKKETLYQRMLRPPQLRYLYHLRKLHRARGFSRFWHKLRLRHFSKITGLQISPHASIGSGLYIPHCGATVIGGDVTLGHFITLGPGVVIGRENRGKRRGSPTIGSNVWIGAHAVIVGKIKVGNNVLIAPGAFVNFDVPDGSIVVGNPGVIHPNEEATRDYIRKDY